MSTSKKLATQQKQNIQDSAVLYAEARAAVVRTERHLIKAFEIHSEAIQSCLRCAALFNECAAAIIPAEETAPAPEQ